MSKSKVNNYEGELETSFDVVLDEGDQLYEGQGRLRKTYERLAKRLDEVGHFIQSCIIVKEKVS